MTLRSAPLAVAILSLAGVLAAQDQTLVIAPHKAPVTGSYPGLCLLVAAGEEGAWEPLGQPIEGFIFEWGCHYRLRVREEPVTNPAAGAPLVKLRLVKVLQQTDVRADNSFTIPLTLARVVPALNGTWYLCDGKQFACAPGVDAEGFGRLLSRGARVIGTFRFAGNPAEPLVLTEWHPVSGEAPTPEGSVAQAIPSDAAPLLREGRVLAPLRAVFEWLGARVEFDPALGRITGRRDPHIIRLQIGSEAATVDGRAVALDAPAVEVGGRTYVPLRFISEALGAEVDWDAEAHTVTITDGARTGTLQVP